jgi:2,5-diketo-D-gluconate reductase A
LHFSPVDAAISDEMEKTKTLNTNASSLFDYRDTKMVKWPGERKLDN